MKNYSSILIAGGAGFVGSSLALRLRAAYPDAVVVAADNLKRRGSEWNLPRLAAANVRFVHADIRRADDLAFPGTRFDLVIDCSAEPAVLAAYESGPAYVIDTNLTGTVNLFELARRDGAAVVFISTSRVYPVAALEAIAVDEAETRFTIAAQQTLAGVSVNGISEAFPLDGARSLYGTTKLACELILAEYADMYGLRYVIDRCGVITGPWQMGKVDQGVFALWMGRHYFGRPLSFIGYGGTGKQVRDFIDVEELGDLILAQIDRIDTLPDRVYNAGGGAASSLSLVELTALCEEITGNRVEITRVAENRPADVRLYVTDNARVTAGIGWSPRKTPRQTLEGIYHWIRENERLVAPLWS
ncbi:MAG: CDP-paratose 2-epimerase [Candidatus Eremiobacteraeota bacterium]|jgi:CDP-paratose 2-epimerase|nr:CDP-paratose 2-epimerase [Candidatus Eremiobacteraeota bacterium]MEA2718873.1 CDP-paratose 2-epimerase [Candidatus Eremiobacteraeota bacterium]